MKTQLSTKKHQKRMKHLMSLVKKESKKGSKTK